MSEMSPSPQRFLERLSDGLQQLIQVVIGSHRKPPRHLKSLLNGTWFGHPLHPVITDVPITAWMLTAASITLFSMQVRRSSTSSPSSSGSWPVQVMELLPPFLASSG